MQYRFSIKHCPGKWHKGPDAMSRNVASTTKSVLEVCAVNPSLDDEDFSQEIESLCTIATVEAITDYGDEV